MASDAQRARLEARLQKLLQTASKGQRRYTARWILIFGATFLTAYALLFMLFHWKFSGHFDHSLVFVMPSVILVTIIPSMAAWPQLQRQIVQLRGQLAQLR
jgi:hypothetical protein